jgi:hypothetical protein
VASVGPKSAYLVLPVGVFLGPFLQHVHAGERELRSSIELKTVVGSVDSDLDPRVTARRNIWAGESLPRMWTSGISDREQQ